MNPLGPLAKGTMNRWKASAIHLGISSIVATIVVILMRLIWYPGIYFDAMGGGTLLILMVGCDVVLGPLITLIIFKPGKKGLKIDLAIIACIQLGALAYGAYVMFIARPVFTVFAVDRFEVVSAADIRPEELAKGTTPEFSSLSLTGPRVVAARLPADPKEREAIMFSAAHSGDDIKQLPRLYVPYADMAADAAKKAKALSVLGARNRNAPEMLQRLESQTGKRESDLGFLPLSARNQSMSVVVDRQSGEIEEMLPLNPW